jgi:CDP-diacylglycerol--glycerol-3-phosphate 3-phosphatidyltransferase
MVVIIVGREFAVTGLRSIAIAQGVTISASKLGKGKMATQVAAIMLLILGRKFLGPFFILGTLTLWLAVFLTVVSGLDYFLKFYKKVTGELPDESGA